VTYAARTARALGLRVAVLTSAAADLALDQALPGVDVHCLPAATSTTFENRYLDGTRRQVLHSQARGLGPADLPAAWRQASIVHLAPVAQEVDVDLGRHFPGALTGATPQGWLRRWDAQGHVYPSAWPGACALLAQMKVVVLSIEDAAHDQDLVSEWATHVPVLVVTRGAAGATLFVDGQASRILAPRVREVDPTGAGDIFATAFLIHLHQAGDPYQAARFATHLASASVTRPGLSSIPTAAEIERCPGQGLVSWSARGVDDG
jgi:sugar/nucleoside kinase (ribokinase family)